jgi:hypothetical protein
LFPIWNEAGLVFVIESEKTHQLTLIWLRKVLLVGMLTHAHLLHIMLTENMPWIEVLHSLFPKI